MTEKPQVYYQLTHIDTHRRNEAENDIRTWKKYFVLGISDTNKMLPMHLQDILPEQVKITLNMIRPSRRNPKISSHSMLEIKFYYNRIPLAPLGTNVIFHKKSIRRRTWEQHVVQVWYIGTTI